jgi:hypothetical protein
MSYTPKNEQILGSDLTGSSGDANRTYTLANDDAIAAMMQIARDEAFLQQGPSFTFDSSTNTVTFLTNIWDEQNITIDYFVTETAVSGTTYCTTLQIARVAGIGVEVFLESLGTGDGSTASYDTDNGNILAGSYAVKYGTSGSNQFSTLTETTDYSIDKNSGSVLLTSAGITKVNGKAIYANYSYSPKQSDTILNTYLESASREVDKLTNGYWGEDKTSYEYFDGYSSGYPQTDEPFGTQIEAYPEFQLKYSGVSSITSITLLDRDGTVNDTLDSDEYRIITDDDNQESRLLVDRTIPNGKANVKVTYVHGYDSVPALIQELTSLVAGIMALVNISGGSYKDPSTYQIGRASFSIGMIYINVKESINQLEARKEHILELYGGNYACV